MKHFDNFNDQTRNVWNKIRVVFSVLICLMMMGCNNMLPAPEFSQQGISGSSKAILPPQNVTASHGLKKKITVSWSPVTGAARYFIYRAETPHDEYVQIQEVSSTESELTINVSSNFSGYFKVAAVDAKGEISNLSLAVYGTSLAVPVITDIVENSDSGSATIYWYMENMDSKSYLNSARFLVKCFNKNGTEKESKTIVATDDNSYTFNNLFPGTTYLYEIEAFNISDQSASEKSLRLDAATAVSLIPQPAVFTASQGSYKDKIVLTVTLPPLSKVQVSNSTDYENYPLYFKIERKNELTQEVKKIDYVNYKGTTDKLVQNDTRDDFAQYNEGDTFIWEDTDNISSGTKYSYKIISYVDNYNVPICHSPSRANEAFGWIPAVPFINSTMIEYQKDYVASNIDSEVKYEYKSQATTFLSATWNSFDKEMDYIFFITETHYKQNADGSINADGIKKLIHNPEGSYFFDTVASITDIPVSYTLFPPTVVTDPSGTETLEGNPLNNDITGYYEFTLHIVPRTSIESIMTAGASVDSIESEALISAVDHNRRLLTTANRLPKAEMTVSDGFADKIAINYTLEEDTDYKLVRKEIDDNGSPDSSTETTFDILSGDATGSFSDDTIDPNKAYQYKIIASTADIKNIESETQNAFPLGAPKLEFISEKLDYATVTLKWKSAVHPFEEKEIKEDASKSKNVVYAISHNGNTYTFNQDTYTGTSSESVDTADYSLSVVNGTDYTLTLKKGIQYFDYSGTVPKIAVSDAGKDLPVELKVSNKISSETNFNKTSVIARTLGPAATTATVTGYEKEINLNWKKVDGVSNYLICRTIYTDSTANTPEKGDAIFVNTGTQKITVEGEDVNTSSVTRAEFTTSSASYTMKDCYAEAANETSPYEKNQSKLSWGLPFGYLVIPVKNEGDIFFTVDNNAKKIAGAQVEFTNLTDIKGATYGYGLNLHASKATSAKTVTIDWEQPYGTTRTPVLYRRKSGSQDKWDYVKVFSKESSTKATNSVDITTYEESVESYEYAISYSSSTSNYNFAPSFVSDSSLHKDTNNEQFNKGYILSLKKNIAATYVEGYKERFTWLPHDFSERAVGPDYYEIQINNYDTKKGWTTIAKISTDLTNGDPGFYAELENSSVNKISMTNADSNNKSERNCIDIVPVFENSIKIDNTTIDTKGISEGILKVLREGKHYYRLVAKRTYKASEESEPEIITASIGDDCSVWAYRQLTDAEVARSAMLALAYTYFLNDGGNPDLTNTGSQFKYGGNHTWTSDNGGTAIFEGRTRATNELGLGKFRQRYTLNNYAPSQLTPSNNESTFLSLTQDSVDGKIKGDADNYVYGFSGLVTGTGSRVTYANPIELTVKPASSDLSNMDTVTILYTMPDENKIMIKVKRNDVTTDIVDTSDGLVRRFWSPMQLNSYKKYEIKNSYFFWWED